MFVKICGTTNLEDAELSVALGADALGFIFAPSKRRVTVEQAAAIVGNLPAQVDKVGVFTDPDVRTIVETVRGAGLTAVQLHMAYDPERIGMLHEALGPGVSLWQVMGVEVGAVDEVALGARMGAPMADPRLAVVLLDSMKDGASGGLGQAFSWQDVSRALVVQHATVRASLKRRGLRTPELAVAGGLRAENVADAIEAMHAWGVDVVTGVEASPGKKSPDRLRAFFAAVRGA